MSYRWIATQAEFEALIDRLVAEPRYALDTEFHRERTYFPKLALMQFATPGDETALVDPLAVDLLALRRLFASDAVAVVHAAQQDLDVLTHSCGAVPARLYDTQLASGFLGYSTPSLVSLLMAELRVAAAKGDRLTDWLRRPLSAEQLAYAAADVDHLLALQDQLDQQLAELGRSDWVAEACEELRQRPVSGTDPSQAWLRIKDVRMLKPRARGVARAVSEWRERRAMSVDVPVRQILPDLAVLGIAQRQPKTTHDLVQARGVEERHSKGNLGKEILSAVADGQRNDIDLPAPDGEDLDRAMRPAVALVSAWMADLARKQRVDTSLLATRADLVALLRGDDNARLLQGWRAELVGDDIQRLVQGRAGLTFDGRGGLRLIDVADDPSG
ncbi:MAG TPA: HRDC domain-containing protein [Ilumatobacteraceae bacterium]|nr:HRDC domain-containing protein [Ilumatobacteraceae bacterium]